MFVFQNSYSGEIAMDFSFFTQNLICVNNFKNPLENKVNKLNLHSETLKCSGLQNKMLDMQMSWE